MSHSESSVYKILARPLGREFPADTGNETCLSCSKWATWIVNGLPYCEKHARYQAGWLLRRKGTVSKSYNSLGFFREPQGNFVPVALRGMSPEARICFLVKAHALKFISDWALWEILSCHHGPMSHLDATEVYQRLGFMPHAGYPFTKEDFNE